MTPEERIAQDKAETREQIAETEQRIKRLAKEEAKAQKAETVAWNKLKGGTPTTDPKYQEWDKTSKHAEQASKNHQNSYARLSSLKEKLRHLDDPAELERRTQVCTRLEGVKMASKEQKVTAKDQGFPAAYLSDNGNFRPGLDARAKSDLVSAIMGEANGKALHTFTPEEAQVLVAARGWEGIVAKARSAREAAAERQAKTKQAKKTTVAEAEGGTEVTPDPKPEKRKRSAQPVGGRKR